MKTLSLFRFLLPGRPELLFMHGVWMDPCQYIRYPDRIQEVGIVNYERAAEFRPDKPISLIPHFDTDESAPGSSSDFRLRHGLGDRPILLNVGVLGRSHKRTDHLLREAVRLPPDWVVLVCGGVQDPTVLEEGRKLLGDRFRHLSLPQNEMKDAYGSASLFVHCATTEGFGIVILEAMKSGLPVLVHDGKLFRWIVKDPDQCLDMTVSGSLGQRLDAIVKDPHRRSALGRKNRETFLREYTWKAVRESYFRFLFA